jgi:hypothetical protein
MVGDSLDLTCAKRQPRFATGRTSVVIGAFRLSEEFRWIAASTFPLHSAYAPTTKANQRWHLCSDPSPGIMLGIGGSVCIRYWSTASWAERMVLSTYMKLCRGILDGVR